MDFDISSLSGLGKQALIVLGINAILFGLGFLFTDRRVFPALAMLLGVVFNCMSTTWSIEAGLFGLGLGVAAVGTHSTFKNTIFKKSNSSDTESFMKSTFLLCILATALAGCARFSTTQKDIRYENGKKVGEITTKASGTTFGTSKSALANFKATQTEKSQGATVGGLNQESSGTNAVAFLEALAKLAAAVPK